MFIGVSTLAVRGLRLAEAISAVRAAGFDTLELVPYVWKPVAEFFRDERKRLRDELADFACVTVHSSAAIGGRLSDDDPAVRHRLRAEYQRLLDFGIELGARVVSFHQMDDVFAGHVIERVRGERVQVGVETFEHQWISEYGCPQLGTLFDVGHAVQRIADSLPATLAEWVGRQAYGIKQLHIHGVARMDGQKVDHLALDEANIVDYEALGAEIRRLRLNAPLILEIGIRDEAPERNLQHCRQAAEILRGA